MRWLLVACLAACSHDSMAIEVVTSDPAIARVELVLVQGRCDGCDGLAPPSSLKKADGDVYYQLTGDRFTAPVVDGVAGFTLEPGKDDDLPKLGAIGFAAQGVPKAIALVDQDIHIKDHLGEVFQIALTTREIQPAVGALPGFTVDANDTVVVWRAPHAADTAASCIAVLGSTNTFVVPSDDPDCDGITGAAECDAFWYQYAKPSDTMNPQYCLEQPSSDKPCQVGTEVGCVDGQSQAGCAPDAICVPQRACVDCTDPSDPMCADHVGTDTGGGIPRIHCQVPLVGTQGNYTSCTVGTQAINLSSQFTAGGMCNPGLLAANVPLPVTPAQTIAVNTSQGPVAFQITNPILACQFTLLVMATVSGAPSGSVPGLVVLHGPTRAIVMPLVVDYTIAGAACQGTSTAPVCNIDTNAFADPMWNCASQ
jgi:hypothetical protein